MDDLIYRYMAKPKVRDYRVISTYLLGRLNPRSFQIAVSVFTLVDGVLSDADDYVKTSIHYR